MDEDDNKKHFNLQKIIEADSQEGKKKKKKKKDKKTEDVKQEEDDFEVIITSSLLSACYVHSDLDLVYIPKQLGLYLAILWLCGFRCID